MAIIAILALWATRINYSRLSQNQQISIETVKIINLVEEIRNNALVGKAVTNASVLETPKSWEIAISPSGGGSVNSSYTLEGWATWNYLSWQTTGNFSLTQIECEKLDGSTGATLSNPIISFEGSQGSISWCPDTTYKILTFEYWIGSLQQEVSINVLSWIIESN